MKILRNIGAGFFTFVLVSMLGILAHDAFAQPKIDYSDTTFSLLDSLEQTDIKWATAQTERQVAEGQLKIAIENENSLKAIHCNTRLAALKSKYSDTVAASSYMDVSAELASLATKGQELRSNCGFLLNQ